MSTDSYILEKIVEDPLERALKAVVYHPLRVLGNKFMDIPVRAVCALKCSAIYISNSSSSPNPILLQHVFVNETVISTQW